MPWSIFEQPNGEQLAVEWAQQLLQGIGAPATPANVAMVYQWEKSEGGGGKFNPLNQGPVPGQPNLTTTGQQYGGGAADFASWEAGIQGAIAYLNMGAYAGVRRALVSGNGGAAAQALWASPWAGSHYGYGAAWNRSTPPAFSGAQLSGAQQEITALGGTAGVATGGPASRVAGASTVPAPPPLSDIPQLNEYINQYYPQFAWLLNEPGVADVIDKAIAGGYGGNTGYMQGQIEQSQWWKTTSAAMRQYEQTLATTPAETNFHVQGSQAAQILAQVQAQAATQGVTLSAAQLQGIAQQAMQFSWNTQQIDVAIGQDVKFAGMNNTNAGTIIDVLKQEAGNYYQNPGDAALQSWAQNIAAGTQTIQQFQAQMLRDAALKWTGYAPQLQQGSNMVQLTDSLRNNVAQLQEIDPSSINFVTNPNYAKMLDYVAPGDKTGVHRVMTQTEADQYVKGTPAFNWQDTQNAKNSVAQLADQMVTTFGKVGT